MQIFSAEPSFELRQLELPQPEAAAATDTPEVKKQKEADAKAFAINAALPAYGVAKVEDVSTTIPLCSVQSCSGLPFDRASIAS